MKLGGHEKNRLEEKQRAVRMYKEKNGKKHETVYFEEWKNPEDNNEVYFRYNYTYFEKDRPNKDWSRLPDLYSETLDPEIEEFV
jgi:hypothetical protein